MGRFHSLVVADRRQETSDCVSLAFAVPKPLQAAFSFAPGQFLTLRATIDGLDQRRSYSICTAPDDGELRVAIKHLPGGIFSAFATTRLRVGDSIDVMPPQGRFGLPAQRGRFYLSLAAGSGITPIMSILKTVLAREPDSRVALLYGNRATAAILFREQLHDLKHRFVDRLAVQHVLSREPQDVPVLNGRLDAEKLRALLPTLADPADIDAAFICGPDTMIDGLGEALRGMGVPEERIHSERFRPATPAGPPPMPIALGMPVATATVIADGRATTIDVAAGETVLDAAQRAGLDLPWSCRGGICSTCRARITQGAATIAQNYALEAWEIEAGYVLTCQAHPTTPHVVVDYDQV
jgi:ring-1,2-phenylacetyl-CoA epoxidase subunit PaaE